MRYNYRDLMKKIYNYMSRALNDEKNLGEISSGLKNIVNSYDGLNRNERFLIYQRAYEVCRANKHYVKDKKKLQKRLYLAKDFDYILSAARNVKKTSELRHKKMLVRAVLQDDDIVFFLCSKHNLPAKDHEKWQGLIYVDRYWRQKISGDMYYAVSSYIRNHDVLTVQEIMGPPVYLTTRPWCGHYFIPLDTKYVLRNSLNKILKDRTYESEVHYDRNKYLKLREECWSRAKII